MLSLPIVLVRMARKGLNGLSGVMIVSSINPPVQTALLMPIAQCQLTGQRSGMKVKAFLLDTTSQWCVPVDMPFNLVTMAPNALVVRWIAFSFLSTQMVYTIRKSGFANVLVLLLTQLNNLCQWDYFQQRSSNQEWHSHFEFFAKHTS